MSKPDSTPTAERNLRTGRALAICLALLAFWTWVDLASKNWAVEALSRAPLTPPSSVCVPDEAGRVFMQRVQKAPIVLVENYLELRYAENCGAAFGMLDRGPSWLRLAIFGPAATAAVLGLLWLFYTGYGGKLFAASVPLIASGALGNLVDRARLGYVVDFIRAHWREGPAWPTFNIADSTITVGVALLLIEGFMTPDKAKKPTPETAQSTAKSAR
jgi:signal peptidase II